MDLYTEDKIIKTVNEQSKKDIGTFINDLEIRIIHKDSNSLEFDLLNCPSSIANALRRSLMTEVETIAFHSVLIRENYSIFPDEFLAHRIGLVPIRVNSDKYLDVESLKFTLNVTNETNENMSVYSNSIAGDKSIYIQPNVLLCKLAPKNSISMELGISRGIGKTHAKWSPVSFASFRLMPRIEFLRNFSKDEIEEIKTLFSKGVIEEIDGMPVPVNPRLEMMSREFLRHEKYASSIKLSREKNWYIFTIETIIEDPIVILKKAIEELKNKCKMIIEEIE